MVTDDFQNTILQDEQTSIENAQLSKKLAKANSQIVEKTNHAASLLELIGRVEDELAKEKVKVREETSKARKLQIEVDSLQSDLALEQKRTAAFRDRAKKLLSSRKRQRRDSDEDD